MGELSGLQTWGKIGENGRFSMGADKILPKVQKCNNYINYFGPKPPCIAGMEFLAYRV